MRYSPGTTIFAAIFLLGGCSGEEKGDRSPDVANEARNETVAAPAKPQKAEAVEIKREDEALKFTYTWPGEAAAIAPLDKWLRSHSDTQYRDAHEQAAGGKKSADKDGYPFHTYEYQQKWDAVADTPEALVLQSQGYEYTGGAHGMPFVTTLIWDRGAQKRLAIGDLIDIPHFSHIVRQVFCDELNRQRTEKRKEWPQPGSAAVPEFASCPMIAEQEIVPVSKRGKGIDTIRIVIGPYVAGPYAEGQYVIELPVDGEMGRSFKRDHPGWFAGPA